MVRIAKIYPQLIWFTFLCVALLAETHSGVPSSRPTTSRSAPNPTQSEEALLRRETSIPLKACDESQFDRCVPTQRRYLERILKHITRSNPDVFKGDLSVSKICIGLQRNDETPRAFTDSLTRTITVFTKFISIAENDAQVATMVAHELAHVSLRHTLCDCTPLTQDRDNVISRQRERERLVERQNLLKRNLVANAAELALVSRQVARLDDEIMSLYHAQLGPERAGNWLEVEADLAGQILYRNAGFAESEFTWRKEQIILFPPSGNVPDASVNQNPIERRLAALRACGLTPLQGTREPARGANRYAEPCWSLWQLGIQNRPRVNTGRQLLTLPGSPTLAEAKQETPDASCRSGN